MPYPEIEFRTQGGTVPRRVSQERRWPPASWTKEIAPANWKHDRTRWDSLHRWRVLLLTVAFVLLAVGIL